MVKRTIVEVVVEDVEKRRLPSKHYVYVICVTWNDGTINIIYRRYSRFFELQSKLLDKFPEDAGTTDPSRRIIPFLPGKILFGRSHIREVALKRLHPIDQYCKTLIKLPAHISECEDVVVFFESSPDDIQYHSKEKGTSVNLGKEISQPMLLEQYVAVADYSKQGRTEINIYAGQRIGVVEKTEIGWWFVSTEDGQGWVPSSHLETDDGSLEDRVVHQATPGKEEKYLVTDTYEARVPDEIGIDKGGFVQVIERNLDGWWLVRYKGRVGRVPATNLTEADSARARRLSGRIPMGPVEVVPNLMAISNIHLQNFDQPAQSDSSANQDTSLKTTNQKPAHSEGVPIAVKPKEGILGKQRQEETRASLRSSRRKLPPPRRNSISQDPPQKKVAPPRPVPPQMEPVYVALSDFQVNVDDGVSLQEGQVVSVLEKTETGWWFVSVGTSRGWAPVSHIAKRNKPVKKYVPRPPRPPTPAQKPPLKTSTARTTKTSHVTKDVLSSVSKLAEILKTNQERHQAIKDRPLIQSNPISSDPVSRIPRRPMASDPTPRSTPLTPPEPPQRSCSAETRTSDSSAETSSSALRRDGSQRYANVDDDDIELKQYIAAYDYEGVELGEVMLNVGDRVEVVGCNPSGWWYVRILAGSGKGDGWVPSSYLKPAAEYSPDEEDDSIYAEVPDEDVYQNVTEENTAAESHQPPYQKSGTDDTSLSRSVSVDDEHTHSGVTVKEKLQSKTALEKQTSPVSPEEELKRLDAFMKTAQKGRPPPLPKKKSLESTASPSPEPSPPPHVGKSNILNIQRALLNNSTSKPQSSPSPPLTEPESPSTLPVLKPKPDIPALKPLAPKTKPQVPASKPSPPTQIKSTQHINKSSPPQVISAKPAVPSKKPAISAKPAIPTTKPQVAIKKPPINNTKPHIPSKSRVTNGLGSKTLSGGMPLKPTVANSKPQVHNGHQRVTKQTPCTVQGISQNKPWPPLKETDSSIAAGPQKFGTPKVQDIAKLFSQR